MNAGNSNEGPSSSGNMDNNPDGPNNPNSGGGSANLWGCKRPQRKGYKSGDDNISDKDVDKLRTLKARSYDLLKSVQGGDRKLIKHLETRDELFKNEIKRSELIKRLNSDRFNEEFLYNASKISQYINSQDTK